MQTRGLPDSEVETWVHELGEGVGLPGHEIAGVLKSALEYEKGEPETVPREGGQARGAQALTENVDRLTIQAGQDLEAIPAEELDKVILTAKRGYWETTKQSLVFGWVLGRALKIRKSQLKFGEWESYLETVKIDTNQASRFMRVAMLDREEALEFASISQVIEHLREARAKLPKEGNPREARLALENLALRRELREENLARVTERERLETEALRNELREEKLATSKNAKKHKKTLARLADLEAENRYFRERRCDFCLAQVPANL